MHIGSTRSTAANDDDVIIINMTSSSRHERESPQGERQAHLHELDAALLEYILSAANAHDLAAVASCSRLLRQVVAAVAEARCAAGQWSRRAAALRRRPCETFVQLLALREQAERRAAGRRLLAAGAAHTVVVSPCGGLFTCGRNGSGQLGTGQTHDNGFEEFEESLCAVPPVGCGVIVCCSCGDESTLAIDERRRLFSWGHGHGSGELTVPLPRLIDMPVPVSSVASGRQHAAAIDFDGHLWTWGIGIHGQLGHPDATKLPHPRLVATFAQPRTEECENGHLPPRVLSVDCGAEHTAAVDRSGCLWTFGRGWLGHDGRPTLAQVTPLKVTMSTTPVQACVDDAARAPQTEVKFVDVSCGEGHTAVLTDEGSVFTFGLDTFGQLGHSWQHSHRQHESVQPYPRKVDHPALNEAGVVQVACGKAHTVVLTSLGVVYSWGNGASGQLGHDEYPPMMREMGDAPSFCSEPLPVVIPLPSRRVQVEINRKGNPLRFTNGETEPEPALEAGFEAVNEHAQRCRERAVEICCGATHTIARLSSGRLASWGSGSWGRLGQGGELDATEPAEVRSPTRWPGWL